MLYRLYRSFSINYARKIIFNPYFSIYIKVFDFRRYKRYKVTVSLRYEEKLRTACAFFGGTQAVQTLFRRYKSPASTPSLRTYGG